MTTRALFTPASSSAKFSPRTGSISIDRQDGTPVIQTDTPALLTATSRGIVPHFSRDSLNRTEAVRHVQVSFESFLDRNPPVPTIVGGAHPLHSFLGYSTDRHVLTLTLRDPSDGRKMPPNGNDFVSAQCSRGVRKISPSAWKTYVQKCNPDVVVALSDTPFTPPPHSQKRLTKSIERSIAWLADFLRAPTGPPDAPVPIPVHVIVHMAGGAEAHARTEFGDRLAEPIEKKDAAGLASLRTLDDGVAGYIFDLLPLHTALSAAERGPLESKNRDELLHISDRQRSSPESSVQLVELLHASLDPLPSNKPRIINSPVSPHEILRIIRDVGIDLVDGTWAQRAADIGIALDFRFPAPTAAAQPGQCPPPRARESGKHDLGHNLFDSSYRHDHSRLASTFADGKSTQHSDSTELPVCPCGACSPRAPSSRLLHSSIDIHAWQDSEHPLPPSALQAPFVRSYIHHLLHTHEMSSHTLLAMHNLTVLSAFLDGVRAVLARGESAQETFAKEVERFEQMYDEDMVLWEEAEKMWLEVEHARGKGRLAREKEKQVASTIGTAVDL